MINALQGTRMGRRVKTPAQALAEIAELGGQENTALEGIVEPSPEKKQFKVNSFDWGWRIGPVKVRGRLSDYYLARGLLDGGALKTGSDWEEYARQTEYLPLERDVTDPAERYTLQTRKGYVPASGNVLFHLLEHLFNAAANHASENWGIAALDAIGSINRAFQRASEERFMIGLFSLVQYGPKNDCVRHNPCFGHCETITGRLWGPQGSMKDTPDLNDYCAAIFDAGRYRVESILRYFTGNFEHLNIHRHTSAPDRASQPAYIGFQVQQNYVTILTPMPHHQKFAMFGIKHVADYDDAGELI